ncbi:MAG: hypothetical protein AB7O57_01410 [Hyphomicrobiaceae bacterium]
MASMVRTGLLAAALAGLAAAPALAQSATGQLSDKSVNVLMGYAWAILPAKFTMPDGRVIEVDKKAKKKETLIPVEAARDVIRAGYNSAQAQLCEMWEEQTINYDAMMRVQRAKNSWSDPQLLYITTLHRMTIHMAAGKLKVTEKDGELVVTLDTIQPTKDTCNDEKRKKVREAVAAQVEAAKAVTPASPKKAEAGDTPTQALPAAVQRK